MPRRDMERLDCLYRDALALLREMENRTENACNEGEKMIQQNIFPQVKIIKGKIRRKPGRRRGSGKFGELQISSVSCPAALVPMLKGLLDVWCENRTSPIPFVVYKYLEKINHDADFTVGPIRTRSLFGGRSSQKNPFAIKQRKNRSKEPLTINVNTFPKWIWGAMFGVIRNSD